MNSAWILLLCLSFYVTYVASFSLSCIEVSRGVNSPMRSFPSTNHRPQRGGQLVMGNNAKFGIFSPAVYAAKFVLGDAKLNKIRGKVISLHSQAITDWCIQYGAYNLRTRLIKMAKTNGDKLGFLV